ncbi:universal stress protein [Loigolactobacillus zhaoyuanensis]|uniref:Universal stress protein n=1 Tax=Loigolactobacillus zhaoyuanensis TaxID=2486017 RepID=A0ABW8U8P4_9LACO|nr:universal stress protein [Loigolactobacillus zhaoyuanensis]
MLQNYQDILVAVDGSAQAQQAFAKAVRIAKLNQGHLLLLNVLDIWNKNYEFQPDAENDNFTQKIFDQTQNYLKVLQQEATQLGVTNCDIHIRFGNPKKIIAHEFSQDHQVDLIVLAATGKNALTRTLTGSVTDYVTRNAQLDVLTVRTDIDNRPIF